MAYLRCPECRLTASATAYYLRGDQCPRCRTAMDLVERFRDAPRPAAALVNGDAALTRSAAAPSP